MTRASGKRVSRVSMPHVKDGTKGRNSILDWQQTTECEDGRLGVAAGDETSLLAGFTKHCHSDG
jgi:hypothetical protein